MPLGGIAARSLHSWETRIKHRIPAPTRRHVLRGAAAGAIAAPGVIGLAGRPAHAAEFVLRLGHDLSVTHPARTNLVAGAKKILEATGGRLEEQVYPSSQLGGDSETLAQVRSGALDMTLGVPSWLTSMIPQCATSDLGFTSVTTANAGPPGTATSATTCAR